VKDLKKIIMNELKSKKDLILGIVILLGILAITGYLSKFSIIKFIELIKYIEKTNTFKYLQPLIATIGTLVTIIIFFQNKNKEMKFKEYEQKKEVYKEFIDFYIKFSKKTVLEKNFELEVEDLSSELLEVLIKTSMFSSDKVTKLIIKFKNEIQKNEESDKNPENFKSIVILGEVLAEIRKDMKFSKGKISSRDILSLTLTDIKDSKYDNYFNKENL